MIRAPGYGLHRHENFVFLHEQDGGRCLMPRLAGLSSPFEVENRWWLPCPHRFGEPEPGPALAHAFVRTMSPAQTGGLYHVRPADVRWLWRLSAMIGGAQRVVEPFGFVKRPRARRAAQLLTLTNAAPQCFIDIEPSDYVDLETLAQLPRTRNLILCGPIKLPGAIPLNPDGLDWDHDWAAEGRRQLHAFIRRQP